MLAVGMPSSADRPGTDHWPGGRLVSTAGRPFRWPRMLRWLIRVRTCWPVNRLVRLGGRNPSELRAPAIWPFVQAADGADGLPGSLVSAGPGDGDVDQFAVPRGRDGDVLDEDAQQLLTAGLAGRRGVPDLGEI